MIDRNRDELIREAIEGPRCGDPSEPKSQIVEQTAEKLGIPVERIGNVYKISYEIEFACQPCLDSRIVVAPDEDSAGRKLMVAIPSAKISGTKFVSRGPVIL